MRVESACKNLRRNYNATHCYSVTNRRLYEESNYCRLRIMILYTRINQAFGIVRIVEEIIWYFNKYLSTFGIKMLMITAFEDIIGKRGKLFFFY